MWVSGASVVRGPGVAREQWLGRGGPEQPFHVGPVFHHWLFSSLKQVDSFS